MKGKIEHHFIVTVRKFKAKNKKEIKDKNIKPYEILTSKHSDLLDEGAEELIDLICGLGTPTAWDAANARCGVGESASAFDATQTGLQGSSKVYVIMDAGWPKRIAAQKAEWKATFGDGVAEQSWQEFTVSNTADDDGKNLMRIIADKGTKGAGETWELTITEEFA